MRRSERQVTDRVQVQAILSQCKVLRLAMIDGARPYVVPLNYGYQMHGDRATFYFHSAHQGRKLDLLRRNPNVCVELDCGHKLTSGGDVACRYGYCYQCVIAQGIAVELTEPAQKAEALKILMRCQTERDFSITEAQAEAVSVWRIDVTQLSAKARYE